MVDMLFGDSRKRAPVIGEQRYLVPQVPADHLRAEHANRRGVPHMCISDVHACDERFDIRREFSRPQCDLGFSSIAEPKVEVGAVIERCSHAHTNFMTRVHHDSFLSLPQRQKPAPGALQPEGGR